MWIFGWLANKLIFWLGLGIVIAGLAAAIYVQTLRMDNAIKDKEAAQKNTEIAVTANKTTSATLHKLLEEDRKNRELTDRLTEESKNKDATIAQIKKEMENVEGGKVPAGPYFDELGRRLRELEGLGSAN